QVEVIPFGDTAEIVQKLLSEKRAGRTTGSLDFIWINGENFRTAKEGKLLWGPFSASLTNIKYYPSAARSRDFGTQIEGYEAPWLRAQFVFAYDTARFPSPPGSIEALGTWMRSHPGRFTYVAPPDFTGSAFVRQVLLHFGDYSPRFQTGFDTRLYDSAARAALAWLNQIKPYLWRGGETYPSSQRELDRLFANNEIDFSMSYSPASRPQIERGAYLERCAHSFSIEVSLEITATWQFRLTLPPRNARSKWWIFSCPLIKCSQFPECLGVHFRMI
ncbi:MAG: ABC transporter substrate-binding protein, partial [Bryobacteraceae bacterium]